MTRRNDEIFILQSTYLYIRCLKDTKFHEYKYVYLIYLPYYTNKCMMLHEKYAHKKALHVARYTLKS